jgi:hypothetical protein
MGGKWWRERDIIFIITNNNLITALFAHVREGEKDVKHLNKRKMSE